MRKVLIFFLYVGIYLGAYERPLVLVTVPAYVSIVQEMAGKAIDVQVIVPPTADFHSFDPTPKAIEELRRAVLWYCIGEPFEYKIRGTLLRQQSPPTIVDLRTGLSLIEDHGSIDPHLWTNPRMMMIQIETIRKGLTAAFPKMEEGIGARYRAVQGRCRQLIEEADRRLSGCEGKPIVIAHGAYGYLCREYGIDQLAIESEGKEATVRALDGLLKQAKTRGVKTVFSVAQHSTQGINRMAQILNASIVEVNPSQPDYFAGESAAIRAFSAALKEEK